jgi:hypothetical protein
MIHYGIEALYRAEELELQTEEVCGNPNELVNLPGQDYYYAPPTLFCFAITKGTLCLCASNSP